MSSELTCDESSLYDRQIRLWGQTGQLFLKKSTVLLIGFNDTAFESTKNLILAGIKSIFIYDKNFSEDDREYLTGLNKNVSVTPVYVDKTEFEDFVESMVPQPDLICLMDSNIANCSKINAFARKIGVNFICGDVFGSFAYFFVDLGDGLSVENKSGKFLQLTEDLLEGIFSQKISPKKWKYFRVLYYLLVSNKLINLSPDSDVESEYNKICEDFPNLSEEQKEFGWFRFSKGSLNPVCAVLGGLMTHKICEILQNTIQGYENLFLYDAFESLGVIVSLSGI